jgi:outer membrane biosynthesis protein TonB
MKVLGVISTTALFLLLGATVPAFAQEEHQEEGAKPAQHEEQAKPAPKQEETKPQKQEEQAKPKVKRNNHRASSHGTVRKTAPDTNTTKVILVQTITLALWQLAGAPTTDAASTPTAAIGSMQDHIQRGSTSRTSTSSWERMGYGMQWHPATLL